MNTHEHEIQPIIREFLRARGWLVYGGKSGVDVRGERTLDQTHYTILVEVKGDVGEGAKAVSGQRLKYIQHALGQLLLRTGSEVRYNAGMVFGVAFPARCWDGTEYFATTLRSRIAPELRELLRLCFFFVNPDGNVTVDAPASVEPRLFAPNS
jgi:hypothetical protein